MSALGFVGLGAMGSRIAVRLLDSGNAVYGTNRTKSRAQPLIGRGLQWRDTRGLVNFHFTSKENLLHAVIEQLVGELEEQMFPPDPPAAPLQALGVLIDAHRRFLTEQPERARLLFRLQAEALNPALGVRAFAALHQRWLERTRPWWEQALAADEIDPTLDHNAVTTFAIGALRGIALEWLLAPDGVDIESAYAHLLRSLQRGLSTEGA